MPVKPFAARHTTVDLGDALRITIPSKRNLLYVLFMSAWLVGWAFGETTALGTLFRGGKFLGPGVSFMFVWLTMWTLGGAYVFFLIAWFLFGQEVLEVSYQSIIFKRAILGLGFPQEYSSAHIRDLRVSAGMANTDIFGWSRTGRMYGLSGGPIAFDYGSRTIRLGSGIDEAEAKQILFEIFQRYPAYRQ